MCKINFVETSPYNSGSYHVVTNEEPRAHARLLRQAKVKNVPLAGSICSGGEVPILLLLPRAQKVIAVDHGMQALASCAMKMTMLHEMGTTEMRKLLKRGYLEVQNEADRFIPQVPEPFQSWISGESSDIQKIMLYLGYKTEEALRRSSGFKLPYRLHSSVKITTDMPRIWLSISARAMEMARERLENLTLVHGDLRDLSQFGPVDVLYVSNARQHSPRDSQELFQKNGSAAIGLAKALAPLVKPNGILLETGDPVISLPEWKLLNRLDVNAVTQRYGQNRDFFGLSWSFTTYRKVG